MSPAPAARREPDVSRQRSATAAFAEYAADRIWVATHLGQFLGIAILGVALVAMAAVMEVGRPSAWARIGVVGTAASVAAAAALRAVDGVALKVMVDRWAQASGDARMRAFEGAFAVRQTSCILLIWAIVAGVYPWRRAPTLAQAIGGA